MYVYMRDTIFSGSLTERHTHTHTHSLWDSRKTQKDNRGNHFYLAARPSLLSTNKAKNREKKKKENERKWLYSDQGKSVAVPSVKRQKISGSCESRHFPCLRTAASQLPSPSLCSIARRDIGGHQANTHPCAPQNTNSSSSFWWHEHKYKHQETERTFFSSRRTLLFRSMSHASCGFREPRTTPYSLHVMTTFSNE